MKRYKNKILVIIISVICLWFAGNYIYKEYIQTQNIFDQMFYSGIRNHYDWWEGRMGGFGNKQLSFEAMPQMERISRDEKSYYTSEGYFPNSYMDEYIRDGESLYTACDRDGKIVKIIGKKRFNKFSIVYRYMYDVETRKLQEEVECDYGELYSGDSNQYLEDFKEQTVDLREILTVIAEYGVTKEDLMEYKKYFLYDKLLTDWLAVNHSRFSVDDWGKVEFIEVLPLASDNSVEEKHTKAINDDISNEETKSVGTTESAETTKSVGMTESSASETSAITVAPEENQYEDDEAKPKLELLSGDITEEEAIQFIQDAYLSYRYARLSKTTVAEEHMEDYYYYVDSVYGSANEFKQYFSQVMSEEVVDYLFFLFDYQIYDGQAVRNTESQMSTYEMDCTGEREFYTVSRTANKYQIKAPFAYFGYVEDVEEKEDYAEIWLEKQSGGEWKITRISQWLNDITYYELKEYALLYTLKSERDFERFLDEYGRDSNGERISIQIIRNGDYILPESDRRRITESDLQPLTKLSAVLAYYEIEARYGYLRSEWLEREERDDIFSFYLYFTSFRPWYEETIILKDDMEPELNDIEKENQEILQRYISSF